MRAMDILQIRKEQGQMKWWKRNPPICCSCGEIKPDMISYLVYVGGVGDVLAHECKECMAKKEREWQKAHEAYIKGRLVNVK